MLGSVCCGCQQYKKHPKDTTKRRTLSENVGMVWTSVSEVDIIAGYFYQAEIAPFPFKICAKNP